MRHQEDYDCSAPSAAGAPGGANIAELRAARDFSLVLDGSKSPNILLPLGMIFLELLPGVDCAEL